MNLVFDLDDTLLDTYPLLIAALNAHTGQDLCPHTQWSYDLPRLYSMSMADIQAVFVRAQVLENAQWLGNAREFNAAVWRWADAGHQVYFCTARGWHSAATKVSTASISHAGQIPHELVVVQYHDNKAQILQDLGIKPDVFVDDNYRQVVNANAVGATSWLYRRRWNFMDIWGNSVDNQLDLVQAVDHSIVQRQGA